MSGAFVVLLLVCLACWAALIRIGSFGRMVPVIGGAFVSGRLVTADVEGGAAWVALAVASLLTVGCVVISWRAIKLGWPVVKELLPIREDDAGR